MKGYRVVFLAPSGKNYLSKRTFRTPEAAGYYAGMLADDPNLYAPSSDRETERITSSAGRSDSAELCAAVAGVEIEEERSRRIRIEMAFQQD